MRASNIIAEYETPLNYACLVKGVREYAVKVGTSRNSNLYYIPFKTEKFALKYFFKYCKIFFSIYKKHLKQCLKEETQLNV